ncbi:NADPH:quinone reductase-like Zn-dependent oxidoreductase [Micromonospora luteifusca]|uniref:NADPH:quinone reductase-like Zn-dependent oxidoreductase n=1 Tax=Micromonospora luteifusca TaxID=709860 RepID=A0ABS2M104_9ACTN|nr:NAD(P)-dependent alcohol dehydrogenase [Micromonospora luteifusca]MBM7494101.1 NADPH:quinone reductase-like Zn-dependent oxidoreductase [Micromonospora luteifusca]
MKAIVQDVYGPADVLALRDIDRPSIGDDEVLVRVRAAGVDPGVWHLMTGRPYLVRAFGFGLRRPKVPVRGRDLAGVVEAVGARVTRLRPGDEVYGTCESGSFAEYATARQDRLAIKPANLSFEQAAVTPISGMTALQGLRDCAGLRPGQRVMVIGAAGGVGSFAVQIAKAFGATVTGVCSTAKVDLVGSLGAADVIDYTHSQIDGNGARYDVIIDTAGNRPVSLLRRALTPRGTLVLVGGEHGGGRLLGGFDRQMLRAPLMSIFVSQRLRSLMAKEHAADLEELRRLIDSGAVTPVIDRAYPLADAADAIRHLAQGHAAGKTVVTV